MAVDMLRKTYIPLFLCAESVCGTVLANGGLDQDGGCALGSVGHARHLKGRPAWPALAAWLGTSSRAGQMWGEPWRPSGYLHRWQMLKPDVRTFSW